MINRLQEIFDAKWLIHRDVILSYIPIFISFLNGSTLTALDNKSVIKPYARSGDINLTMCYDLTSPDIPSNSVAVIPIQGVLVSWVTMDIVRYIQMAEANPNIIAIVFLTNTPGGMVFYIDIADAAIKKSPLPSVAYVMNMAASSGQWLISSAKRIFASSPMDQFGCIGTMTTYIDMMGFLKDKLGISIIDIYASKSTRKNEAIRKLQDTSLTMEERTAGVVDQLDFVNEFFHKAIRNNLGIKKDSEVFTGATYFAQQAIDLGLAHEINTLDYAINYAYKLGLANNIKNQFNKSKT